MVNNIPLGPNAVSIEVVKVFNDQAYLWRPTADMFLIGDALSEKIASPSKPAKKKAVVCN